MTLREMITTLDLEIVWLKFKDYYLKDKEYCNQSIFEYLCCELEILEFEPCKFTKILIHGNNFVSGFISDNHPTYAIEYTLWNKWIDLEVYTSLDISNEEALAHVLWEASWNGWTYDTHLKNIGVH